MRERLSEVLEQLPETRLGSAELGSAERAKSLPAALCPLPFALCRRQPQVALRPELEARLEDQNGQIEAVCSGTVSGRISRAALLKL